MDYTVIKEVYPAGAAASRSVRIILAENGSLYDFPISKFVSSISLKKSSFLMDFIEKEYGINKTNQLVLRSDDGKKLESAMNLEDYFQKDTTIYVYVMKGQREEQAHDDFEIIGCLSLEKKWSDSCNQILPSIYENRLGSNVREKLEPHVLTPYDDLMAMFADVKGESNSVKEGILKIKRQKNAEGVAKKNLVNYYGEKKKQFDETLAEQEAKIDTFQNFIDTFDQNIEKLSKQEIDQQLGEDDKTYLIEYFEIEKLEKSKAGYEKNQAKIKQKAQEIKDEIVQYDNELNKINGTIEDTSEEIQRQLHEQENIFIDIQDTHLQALNSLIEESKGDPLPKDLGDFIKRESEIMLPKLRAIYQRLREIRQNIDNYLKENASKLKDLISDIINLRVIIKGKIYNKLKVFCSLVNKHAEGIFNLEIIEKFPWVYQQSLTEIKRRCAFKKDYLTVLSILESYVNSENRARQDFLEMYQQFLPKTFCPFLSKTFPQLKFENIKRMIDQDLCISFHENSPNNLNKSNTEADILRLLKNLNDNLESKDTKNKELENYIDSLSEKAEMLEEQLKQKSLNVTNLRKLLGSTGFQEKIDDFLGAYKHRFFDKIEQVEKRVNELQSEKMDSFNKIVNQLQITRQKDLEAYAKLEELERLRGENEEKIAALESSLESKNEKVKELEEKHEELQKNLDTLMKENKDLLVKKEEMEEELSKLEEKCKELKETEEEKSKMIVDLEARIEATKQELEKKERDIDDILTQSMNQDVNGKESQDKQIDELSMVMRVLQDELAAKEKDLTQHQETIKEITKEKGDLEVKIKELAKGKDDLEVKIKESAKEKGHLEAKVKEFAKGKDDLEAKIKDLTKEKHEIEKKLKDSQDELEATKKKLEVIEQRAKELFNDRKNMNAKLEETQKALSQKEKEVIDKDKIVEDKEKEIQNLREEVKTLGLEIGKLTGEIQGIKDELSRANKLLEDEKTESVKKENELTEFTMKMTTLQYDLTQKETEILQIKSRLEEKEIELDETNRNLMGTSIMGTTNAMLGEIGEYILDLYQSLFGKDAFGRIKTKEFDLKEILEEIRKLITTCMVKIDGLEVGDKAIAVRLFESDDFIMINKQAMLYKTVHLFRPQEKNLEDIIVGQVESFGNYFNVLPNKALKDTEAVIEVKLGNIEPLCIVPITKPAKKA